MDSFGEIENKRGRPPEDLFVRRLEIYNAVVPLISSVGARGITMRQAAKAAHLSVGGIYHYFKTKRELLLFPFGPEICREWTLRFEVAHGHLRQSDPIAYLDTFIDATAGTLTLLRPALEAALEMGTEDARRILESSLTGGAEDLAATARELSPHAASHESGTLERALKRECLAALVDRSVTPGELRASFRAFIYGEPLEHFAMVEDGGGFRLHQPA